MAAITQLVVKIEEMISIFFIFNWLIILIVTEKIRESIIMSSIYLVESLLIM